jgi:hypothetical protein
MHNRGIGVRFTKEARDFFSTAFRPALGPTKFLIQRVPWSVSPWVMQLECDFTFYYNNSSLRNAILEIIFGIYHAIIPRKRISLPWSRSRTHCWHDPYSSVTKAEQLNKPAGAGTHAWRSKVNNSPQLSLQEKQAYFVFTNLSTTRCLGEC